MVKRFDRIDGLCSDSHDKTYFHFISALEMNDLWLMSYLVRANEQTSPTTWKPTRDEFQEENFPIS